MQRSTYDPRNQNDFDKTKMTFNAQGVKANPSLNSDTNLDLYFTDDHVVTGFWIVGINANSGDNVDIKVIDTDNVMGFGAGVTIRQFGTSIYVPNDFNINFDVAYPAKVFAGMTLRVVYHSTLLIGTTPFFAVNWKVHKVLI